MSGGTVSTASMAPMRSLLSSAVALATETSSSSHVTRARMWSSYWSMISAQTLAFVAGKPPHTFPDHALVDLARLFRQHDRDAVADRIGELCGARDQLLPRGVELQRSLGDRAHQDFEQFWVGGALGVVGRRI